MRIGTNDEYLELEELERLPDGPGAGDVHLSVTLRLQSFYGTYDKVWIGASDIQQFLAQLAALETARSGSATLSSLSPDQFTLEIRSSDALGHMELETQLHRYQFSGRKNWPIYLRGGFEVEPHSIMQLIDHFS